MSLDRLRKTMQRPFERFQTNWFTQARIHPNVEVHLQVSGLEARRQANDGQISLG